MTIEACAMFSWPYQGIASRLRRHSHNLQQLKPFHEALKRIMLLGLHIIPVIEVHVAQAADLSRQYGLLTNDALVIALMQDQGLTHLASNDADFDRVPGIIRYAPV